MLGGIGHDLSRDLFRVAFARKVLFDGRGMAFQKRLRGGNLRAKEWILLAEEGLDLGVGRMQGLESDGINRLHLQHLKRGLISIRPGRRRKLVADGLEYAGSQQPIARRFKIRLAGELPGFQTRRRQGLLRCGRVAGGSSTTTNSPTGGRPACCRYSNR